MWCPKKYYYFSSYKKVWQNPSTRLVVSLKLGVKNMENTLHLIKNIVI